MIKAVVLFHSTNYAMWASDVFKGKKIECKMVPVPREFSSDCGYCIKINNENVPEAENILKNNDIEYDRIEIINK